MMEPMLSIEIIWQDDDMVEIEVVASNGCFAGNTDVYTTYDDLSNLLKDITGFPSSTSDKANFSAGVPDSFSFFSARFYCWNRTGHTAVRICLESNVPTEFRDDEKDKLEMELKYEAASVDGFEKQLKRMILNKNGSAVLKGIDHL